MKITKKILENIIKEEINKILREGYNNIDVLNMNQTMPRPSAQQFKNEPVATYIIQRINAALERINGRLEKLEKKDNNNNQNSTYAGNTEIKELKQIIAQETVATIMEQSDCKQVRLEDLEQIEELFDNICELLDDFIDKKREMLSPEENVTIDADTLRTTDKEMPGDIPSEQSHEVVAGDTFWELARTYLGNPLRWKEIMNANMGLLKNRPKMQFKNTPEKIPPIRPGDILTIPSRS